MTRNGNDRHEGDWGGGGGKGVKSRHELTVMVVSQLDVFNIIKGSIDLLNIIDRYDTSSGFRFSDVLPS